MWQVRPQGSGRPDAGRRLGRAAALSGLLMLAACASIDMRPTNMPASPAVRPVASDDAAADDRVAVVLTLSGGGTRSAAFAYGVLSSLAERRVPGRQGKSLADDVTTVAGVSGGAILAAHFAVNGPAGLPDFRRDFLDRDVEAALRTAYSPENLWRAYRAGVNDMSGLPAWLDAHLFRGTKLGHVQGGGRPRLLLHATDMYNRTPFYFDRETFAAICSDYDAYPLADAVAASAAVPVLFAPVVMTNYGRGCAPAAGPGAKPVRRASLIERHHRETAVRYADAVDLNYLKLYDGGLVDGLGTQSLLHHLDGSTPGLMSPERARHLRRLLVVVVDASSRIGGDLSRRIEGPSGPEALIAAADAMIDVSSRHSFDALRERLPRWRDALVRRRCVDGMHCAPLDVHIVRVSLMDEPDPQVRRRVLGLHNRLSLARDDVDFLAERGRRLLETNAEMLVFLRGLAEDGRAGGLR